MIHILVIVCVIQTTLVEMIVNIALRDIMDIQIVKVWSISITIINMLTYQHFFHWNQFSDCMCHPEGSLEISCNQTTGQCSCKNHIAGVNCDQCEPGYFGFPHCQRKLFFYYYNHLLKPESWYDLLIILIFSLPLQWTWNHGFPMWWKWKMFVQKSNHWWQVWLLSSRDIWFSPLPW